jgi:hypothetical protein
VKRTWNFWLVAGLIALIAGMVAAPTAGAATKRGCKPARNIEAIIDDSGSMAATDPDRLRVEGLDLLINTLRESRRSTYLGAVEFGSGLFGTPPANTIFPPEPVGPNAAAMEAALNQVIQADNGSTDYNGAFAKSDADNPTADARIFLTDGGHNVGVYTEAHLVHPVPTFVIGFGIIAPSDLARLQKIAGDTGARYFSVQELGELQPVMNKIGAALTCQTPPRQFIDLLKQGQKKGHNVGITPRTRAVQLTLTWVNPADKFKIYGLKVVAGKRTVAVASASRRRKPRKPRKLRVRQKTGATFTVLNVSHLRKGRLRFKVRAAKVASGAQATLTTQVSQKKRK